MSHRTKTELATAVMRRGGWLDAWEAAPAAADQAFIFAEYDAKLEEWRNREFAYWTNTDATTEEIPVEVFSAVVDLMTNVVASAFGETNPPEQQEQREEMLLVRLRRHAMRPSSDMPTMTSYY